VCAHFLKEGKEKEEKEEKDQAATEFQAKCAPPVRGLGHTMVSRCIQGNYAEIGTTVHIEEVPDAIMDVEGLSPLMQERLNRAKDAQANMVDGIVVPKKKAKAKAQGSVGWTSAETDEEYKVKLEVHREMTRPKMEAYHRNLAEWKTQIGAPQAEIDRHLNLVAKFASPSNEPIEGANPSGSSSSKD
tara:strand:- start:375 stop:935 length:561 start_codon:yes stop_codon:yes gene_type:complete